MIVKILGKKFGSNHLIKRFPKSVRKGLCQKKVHDIDCVHMAGAESEELMAKTKGIAIAAYLIDIDVIVVLDGFFRLTEPAQKFVLNHEVGHRLAYLGQLPNSEDNDQKEIDADNYARSKVGSSFSYEALWEVVTASFEIYNAYYQNLERGKWEETFSKRLHNLMIN